jgi:hydrogenase nickel incorporation protein HypA/HybF
MHEYSIVQALLDRVEDEARRHRATSVHRLSLRIGELSGVEVDLLVSAYMTFREQTICAEALLDVKSVPAQWECPACAQPLRRGARLQCPVCDRPARLVEGGEIMLDHIEMEVP